MIIIVGPKHAGKTSAGKALARLWEGGGAEIGGAGGNSPGSGGAGGGGPEAAALGAAARFIDLDELVESREGASPRLLYRAGPGVFRKAEAEALRSLLEGAKLERAAPEGGCVTIVAAGGGLADNREALELLNTSRALVVYLEVPAGTAWGRIRAAAELTGELPPFLDTENPQETHRLLHERRGRVYRELAEITVAAGDSPEETAARILRRLMDGPPGEIR
ncbi:MAG: shikimate kinase [Treponema sp.]|nr:shikimate kinase [Treponema sp.]